MKLGMPEDSLPVQEMFERFFATESIERRKRKGARPSGAAGIGRRGEATSRAAPARDSMDEPPLASRAAREPRRDHTAPDRADGFLSR